MSDTKPELTLDELMQLAESPEKTAAVNEFIENLSDEQIQEDLDRLFPPMQIHIDSTGLATVLKLTDIPPKQYGEMVEYQKRCKEAHAEREKALFETVFNKPLNLEPGGMNYVGEPPKDERKPVSPALAAVADRFEALAEKLLDWAQKIRPSMSCPYCGR